MTKLLAELTEVPVPRTARFVTVISVALPRRGLVLRGGRTRRRDRDARAVIRDLDMTRSSPREADGRTLAELSPEKKNAPVAPRLAHSARSAKNSRRG